MRAPDDQRRPCPALEDDPAATHLALEATGVGIFEFDPATGRQRFSARCREIWGLRDDEEPTAERIQSLIHPEDRALAQVAVDSLRPDGPGEFSIEHRIVRPDGAVRWVQARGRTEFAGTGPARRAVRSLGTMLDVTEQVRAFRALAEAEANHRWAVELNPQVPWIADADNALVEFNERWLELTGLTREQALGDGWKAAQHPDDLPRMAAAWERAIATGEPYDVEHRTRVATGGWRWMRSYARARRDADGRIVRWYGTTEDVDARRRAEDALRDTEARYRAVLANPAIVLATCDAALRYTWLHNPDVEHAGRTLLGRRDTEIADHAGTRALEALKRRVLETGGDVRETIAFPRGGGERHYDVLARPIRAADGRVVGVATTALDISARVEAERRLARSAATFEALIRGNPFGIYVVDADFRLRYVSRGSEKVFENVRPLLGRDFAEILRTIWPEPFASEAIARFRQTLATGEAYVAPRIVERRLDVAAAQSYDWRIERIELPEGGHGVVCYFYDLSERVEWERRLRDSEDFYRQTLESIPGMTFTTRPDGACDYLSEQWSRFTGLPVGELLGDRWVEMLHPEDRPRAFAAWRSAVERDADYDIEYRVRHRDGHYEWFKARGSAIRDAEGAVVRWLGMAMNVDGLKRTEARLRESEDRFQLASEALRGHVYDADVVAGTVRWSAGIHELTGYGPGEIPDAATWWFQRIHPDDVPEMRRHGEAQIAAGASVYELQYRIVRKDGGIRWVLDRSRLLRAPDGRLLRNVGSVLDITALKEAEQAIRDSERRLSEALAELEHADRRKDQFLATLSHELRNPLAPIRTSAQLLASPKLTPQQLQWAQGVIQRQVAHMALLLDDLLDIARVTQGKLDLKRERVALPGVVDAAVEAARPLLERKHHRLTVDLPDTVPPLDADPLRLAQVLSNLLTNAAKYTDPGGHVELRARVDGGALEITVVDDGIGIPPEALPRLFAMFEQVHGTDARAEGGLGIGLALVKGLVELHGGTVEARSDGPGLGSTFTVRLPLGVAAPAAGDAATDAPPADAPRLRVLLADDNRDSADALAMLLGLSGHDVRVAYDGNAALALAAGFRPHVALLDIGMPGRDGYEVARALRAEAWGREVRLIAATGWGQEDDKARAAAAGFDHHLTKPVDPEALERLLAAAEIKGA